MKTADNLSEESVVIKPGLEFKEKISYTKYILSAIILIGIALRLIGISWGLPVILHPDEPFITEPAFNLAKDHSFEPRIYGRPDHITIKTNSLIFLVANKLFFGMSRGTSIPENFNDHIKLFYTAARLFTALLGSLSVFLVFLIIKYFNIKIALIASFLFAVFPAFIIHSHYITPEIVQTFFMLCVAYFSVRYFENAKFLYIILMSVSAAVAFVEKYPAVYSCLIIACTIIVVHCKNKNVLVLRGAGAIITFLLSIFILSPVLVVDYKNVIRAVTFEARPYHLGADGLGFFGNLLFYFKTYLSYSQICLFCFSFIGIYFCIKNYGKKALPLITGIFYIVMMSVLKIHWERWGVPFYAFMLLPASFGIYHIIMIVGFFMKKIKYKKLYLVGVYTVLLGLPFLNLCLSGIIRTAAFVAKDTRVVSMQYCSDNGISQENALAEGYTPFYPNGSGTIFHSDNFYQEKNIKYIILSSSMYDRFYAEPERYRNEIDFYEDIKEKCHIYKIFEPVKIKNSFFEIMNIKNSLVSLYNYAKGGNSGPTLAVYAKSPQNSAADFSIPVF
ncbi:MAG: glycosyltransferase family 39 protein [Spirochaetaceae bacterium]|jgi:hypothetical protein|nr:glycosyltransferase family 39 protein [Spirochaetaceae bacterium]